jgi:hypothetical protein
MALGSMDEGNDEEAIELAAPAWAWAKRNAAVGG